VKGCAPGPTRRDGFGLVAAIFLLVVMSAAAGGMVSLSGVQHHSGAVALQAVRALHAARSGIQWEIAQVISGGTCPADSTLALAEGGLMGFSVAVSCTSSDHTEAGSTASTYTLVAVAEYAAFGQLDYVRRRLQATVTGAP